MTIDHACCHYCHTSNSIENMRLLITSSGPGWRCPHCVETARDDMASSRLPLQQDNDHLVWQARFADALAGNTYA